MQGSWRREVTVCFSWRPPFGHKLWRRYISLRSNFTAQLLLSRKVFSANCNLMALVEHQALRVTRRLNLSASFYLTSPRMHDVRASLVPFCGKNFPSAEANANWLATNGL